jgi:hypothetical protein
MIPEIPQAPAGTVAVADGTALRVDQLLEKGYEFVRGAGAVWSGVLEGSVTNRNWSTIAALGVSSDGDIPARFMYVRVRPTVGGALGTGTELIIVGKVV